ncbi:MAG: rRNA maturation RNase YbeY [Flavobacteriales bacterium]|nr:rRNA maturation RNase YbeY [Flavobacteriales bacterium]
MATIAFKAAGVPHAFRDKERLRRWLMGVARDHGHSINELTYVLLSDAELLEYNQRYLGHDEYTDVITFDGQTGTGVSGDIRENARTFGVSAQHELRRVMVHGLLHLLGHRDKSKAQRDAMRAQEDHYLARL